MRGLAALALLLVVAVGVVYLLTEIRLRRRHPVPADSVALPSDSLSIAEGRRLALIRGCAGGCHGDNVEGKVFFDDPLIATLAAPNLTAAVREYSDAELAAIIRHGVRPDGRSVIAMPSDKFRRLADADLGKIIAYLRSEPPVEGQGRHVRVGPMGRVGMLAGMYAPTVDYVKRAEQLDARYPDDGSTAAGAYLARTACAECHGLDLRGESGGTPAGAPDLRVVSAYSPEEFARLMRTGVAVGGRTLGLMSETARGRFVHFTDGEIDDLYRYLVARAALPDSAVPRAE